jgi:hypothetical protein
VVGLWGAPGGKIPRARLYPNSTFLKGGALAPLVVSSDLAHLRVWEVGWGNVPLFFRGVLVRESRATSLAGARWGLSPGGGSTVTLIHSTPSPHKLPQPRPLRTEGDHDRSPRAGIDPVRRLCFAEHSLDTSRRRPNFDMS